MKLITVNNQRCVIQSYLKDEFVNICPIQDSRTPFDKVLGGFKITFYDNEIQTGGKETAYWKEFESGIDIKLIKSQVDKLFA